MKAKAKEYAWLLAYWGGIGGAYPEQEPRLIFLGHGLHTPKEARDWASLGNNPGERPYALVRMDWRLLDQLSMRDVIGPHQDEIKEQFFTEQWLQQTQGGR